MPSALNKVQKRISKKRTGKIGKSASLNALHENSRDAQRIRRAAARDEKIIRNERERERKNDRYLKRLSHIHAAVRLASLQPASIPQSTTSTTPAPDPSQDATMSDPTPSSSSPSSFTASSMHDLIQDHLSSLSRSLQQHEKDRRPGRPKTREHERAEAEKAAEESEYDSGFWMVDLRDGENVRKFERWDGRWEGLGNLRFVRVVRDVGGEGGQGGDDGVRGSGFPPGGES